MKQIKDKELWIERIMDTLNPKIDKNDMNQLTMKEKIALGKEIEQMMSIEKDKLSHESQVLKDRMDI